MHAVKPEKDRWIQLTDADEIEAITAQGVSDSKKPGQNLVTHKRKEIENMDIEDKIGLTTCIPLACACAWIHSLSSLIVIAIILSCAIWLSEPPQRGTEHGS